MKNELYYGDNLDVLRRKIASESVDLCYIDPPFNSKRNYFQIYNNQGSEDRAQAQAFVDTWEWGDEAAEGLEYILDIERLHGGHAGAVKWTVQTVALNQARINEKKGGDGGIDGIAYFLLDKESNGKAVFQVKSGKTGRGDLAKLNSDRIREKAEFGILLCMDLPTKAMPDEIDAAGKFKHPLLNREDDRLQVVTVAEMFQGKRLDLPMARADAVKSARATGDADRQATLL